MNQVKSIVTQNEDMVERINELKKENSELKMRISVLEKENIDLKMRIDILENDKNKFDALVKLNECDSLVNKAFKQEYKKYFKKGRNDYIPNIGDYVNDPPTDNTDPEFAFWQYFKNKYPLQLFSTHILEFFLNLWDI